jgi:hypothetical protein
MCDGSGTLMGTPSRYSDRFDPATFADDEPIEIRAYRGGRASTFKEHVVPEELFVRLLLIASAYKLHQLPTLNQYGPFTLNPEQARRIAEETRFVAGIVNDDLLVPHLTAVAEVADYCWQHSGEGRLVIEGP